MSIQQSRALATDQAATATVTATLTDQRPSGLATATVVAATRGGVPPTAPAAAPSPAPAPAPVRPGEVGTGFEVVPDQYWAAAAPLLAAAQRANDAYLALDGHLTSLNARTPWGNDESGHQFADGEKGYLAYSAGTLKGLKGLPGALRRIGERLKVMADRYEQTEAAVVVALTGHGRQLAAVPAPGRPVATGLPTGAPAVPAPAAPDLSVPIPPAATVADIGGGRAAHGRR
ncbi:hypothetical protein ACWGB8_11930 [Kitasatospora sp. NPDC054939]